MYQIWCKFGKNDVKAEGTVIWTNEPVFAIFIELSTPAFSVEAPVLNRFC